MLALVLATVVCNVDHADPPALTETMIRALNTIYHTEANSVRVTLVTLVLSGQRRISGLWFCLIERELLHV